jgi:hypothetical protein
MFNFWGPFAWATPTLIIPHWYYYPFNPYEPYVCQCVSVGVCVYECVSVSVYVCACVSMCVCKNLKKSLKIQKISKNI